LGGRTRSILETFRRYGWELTLAGAHRTVLPCSFARQRGVEPLKLDVTVDELTDTARYDGISILPGPAHRGLIDSPAVMRLIREAAEVDRALSAWCRGVRVLAAADVLRGRRVVGHADDREIIEAAGGIYVGHDHPPVTDGRLVTGARSNFYRRENAEAIRAVVEAIAAARRE